MNNNIENQKKKNDNEESWYARMNELENIWKNKMTESRLEYLDNYNLMTKNQSESGLTAK